MLSEILAKIGLKAKDTSEKSELENNGIKRCVFCGSTKVYAKTDVSDAYVCGPCYSCLDPIHY